jgi:hypothetical protein
MPERVDLTVIWQNVAASSASDRLKYMLCYAQQANIVADH